MNSRNIAVVAVLSALSIGTNYAMVSLPNVKLMDLIVFVGGFCFGPVVGGLTGVFSWVVYGALNPQGFSLPIWLATMSCEAIYGVAGALVRRILNPRELGALKNWRFSVGVFFGLLSVFLTFIYDLVTNVVFGYVSNLDIVVSVVFGFATFGVIHMLSNALFFGVGCVPAINALSKVVGGKDIGVSEE